MTDFEMLLACYRSGQVSERQWQAHMEDKAFRAWVEDQLPINCPRDCSGEDNPGQEVAMPDRINMVRESEWREMREALKALLGLVQDQPNETDLAFGITEIEPYLKVDGSTLGVIARARAALKQAEAVP